jgi:hypothetical protein
MQYLYQGNSYALDFFLELQYLQGKLKTSQITQLGLGY